jgi:ribonuclease VapC
VIVDSSALVAILIEEPDYAMYINSIRNAGSKWMSATSLLEACIVLRREKGAEGVRLLRQFIADSGIGVVPFTEIDAEMAFDAYTRFKGTGHGARLNILDTCAYALAVRMKEPLLFKGMDFSKTDVIPALP